MNHVPAELLKTLEAKRPGIDLGLGRMQQLLHALGNPQQRIPPVIHIAGTNGKGSTLAFLHAIFNAAGLRCHRYTSPHLVSFNERIVLADHMVSDMELGPVLEQVRDANEPIEATFFEATTAAAYLLFAKHSADITLLETGLGGRLDATNVIKQPIATIITAIGMDHMEYLGDSLEAIAMEKAGIFKATSPAVIGPQKPGITETLIHHARQVGASRFAYEHEWKVVDAHSAPHYQSERWHIPLSPLGLIGKHQTYNAAQAIAALDACLTDGTLSAPIDENAIRNGLKTAHIPARLQQLTQGALVDLLLPNIELWLDGGHNADAGQVLAGQCEQWETTDPQPLYLVCGMMKDKQIKAFLAPLAKFIHNAYIVEVAGQERSASQSDLDNIFNELAIPHQCSDGLSPALVDITKSAKGPARILIAGSLYLAGQALAENRHGRP